MAKKYDVVTVTGKYVNAQGEEKARWLKCGSVLEINGKFKLKMDAFPVGGEGWFELMPPKPAQEQHVAPDSFDDEIPF